MEALVYTIHSDEAVILTAILQQNGISARITKDLDAAVENTYQRPVDLILLALSSEPERVLQFIRQMRVHTITPILLIVEPQDEDSLVALMEAGSDLIISRPYGVRLLSAQIRTIVRRSTGMPFHTLPELTQSGISLNPATRTASVSGSEPRRLTQLEFRLLYTFITHPGQIIPTENLVEYVWGYSGDGNRELVRGLVQRLRSKIEPDPGNPVYVLTEPGIGYSLVRDSPIPAQSRA